MTPRELEERTKVFAVRCLKVVDALPKTAAGRCVGQQLAASSTSVGANYRAATRARSRAEWFAKLCIVIEECDESVYWLELITAAEMLKPSLVEPLHLEATELTRIFSATRHTARAKQIVKSSNRQIAK